MRHSRNSLYKKELADCFDIAVVIPGTRSYCFKPMNYRSITTAVTSLSTSFTTHHITKNLKPNCTDILVSQMIMLSSYTACEYERKVVIGDRVLLKKKTAAGLKTTMFSLSYMHHVPIQVKHIKCYQNYYPKLRINIGAGSH
jgi:hypothetical protein